MPKTEAIIQDYINTIIYELCNTDSVVSEYEYSATDNDETLSYKITQIELFINKQLDLIPYTDELVLAAFLVRNECKRKMWKRTPNLDTWTRCYKVINIFFHVANKHSSQKKKILTGHERDYIRLIISGILTILYNVQNYNGNFYDNTAVEKFFSRLQDVSKMKRDLHSYTISSLSIHQCLKLTGLSLESIRKNALKNFESDFITQHDLEIRSDWNEIVYNYSLPDPPEVLRIPKTVFERLESNLKKFLLNFDVNICKSPIDSEAEFAFLYKYNDYYYIGLSVMNTSQAMIEDFISWGQYPELLKYYFNRSTNTSILQSYNRLLTFKIADLLITNGYVLPSEKKNKTQVPMIEIQRYSNNKTKCRELGDIDLAFYSPFTKTLYIIEFKNYQMMISRLKDLSSEISKFEREETSRKVIARKSYVSECIDEFISTVFRDESLDVCQVKSIVLSTKPCFYFFLNDSIEYAYYDWIDFERIIRQQEL